MFFPMMNKGNEKTSVISAFGGLNRLQSSALGELSDMHNMNSDAFPALRTSYSFDALSYSTDFNNIQAFLPFDELKFTGIADNKFYYDGKEIPLAYSFMRIDSTPDLQLINFSDSIIIIPYMYVFEYKNTKKNDKLYPLTPGIYDSYISVDTGGENNSPIEVTLEGYPSTWSELGFRTGDSVIIQTDEELYSPLNVYISKDKYDIPDTNAVAYAIIKSITDTVLKIDMCNYKGKVLNITDTRHEIINHTFKNTLRIFKRYPEFNSACIYANRLWVTALNGETIHASSPGKPGEFTDFSGLSTDSWYTEVGESGVFTGITGFHNGVIAFKENTIYHIFGDRPTNFSIQKKLSNCGCIDKKSICQTDTAIYFLSPDGIYEYSGNTPENISKKLNLKNCTGGNAFSDGKKYYISLNSENNMLVYDRSYNLWHCEGDFNMTCGALLNNNLYFASNTAIFKMSNVSENSWDVTLCDITENMINQKGVNDLFVYAKNGKNSYIEIFYRVNSDDFRPCGKADSPGEYTFRIPVRFKKGDKYTIKISGKGDSVIKTIERSFYHGGKAFTRKG